MHGNTDRFRHPVYLLLLLVLLSSVADAAEDAWVVRGQPKTTVEEKLRGIVVPCAPFLRAQDSVCEVLEWLRIRCFELDPEGLGVAIECDVPGEAAIATAKDYAEAFLSCDTIRGPYISRISVADYLRYLAEIRNLSVTISSGKVLVRRAEDAEDGPKR